MEPLIEEASMETLIYEGEILCVVSSLCPFSYLRNVGDETSLYLFPCLAVCGIVAAPPAETIGLVLRLSMSEATPFSLSV